ncbi:MAG: RnfABCDGE type electron transport complex subunit B [Oscillospiraceae bacterium]|jgi:Na+-translocating ferredoxin:NAD+ oxidoreductase RNF subunit RnfB|nr:RnfABCDGE type electron transport complex subunit B [Oscillospiraceae bacterium]
MDTLSAILVLGGLGVTLGLLLAFAARLFKAEADPRAGDITDLLPGINCGGCGYETCQAFAKELNAGQADAAGCPVGGQELAEKLSALLGVEMKEGLRLAVLVRCSGGVRARDKFQYEGIGDCHAAMRIGGGPKECPYGCVGLGSCVHACPFGAISVVDGVAVVDPERCTGCRLCVSSCPKHIIVPVPYHADVHIACSSLEKGGTLRKICDIGCLGCRICEKVCISGAVRVEDNCASIDFEKCSGCGDCAEKCPRKLIVDAKLDRGPRLMEG